MVLRQHASLVEPLHREHANPDDTNSAVEVYLQVGRDVRPRSMLLELAAQVSDLPISLPISPEIFEWTLECSPNIAEWDEASETVVEGWRAYSVWHRGAAYVSGRKVSSKRLRYISPTSPLYLPCISPISRR